MADPDDAHDDPDLVELLLHADREELEGHLTLARRLLEAAGDEDLDDPLRARRSSRASTS